LGRHETSRHWQFAKNRRGCDILRSDESQQLSWGLSDAIESRLMSTIISAITMTQCSVFSRSPLKRICLTIFIAFAVPLWTVPRWTLDQLPLALIRTF